MQIGLILKAMFPNVEFGKYEVVNGEITVWKLEDPQPTAEELEAYWMEHKQQLLSEQLKPPKTEFEILKETVDQLVLDDLMRGV